MKKDLDKYIMNFKSSDNYIKLFSGNGQKLFNELSYSQIAFLVFLCDYICYDDCAIRMNGKKNGRLLTMNELAELSGINIEALRKTIYALRDKKVIGIHPYEDDKTRRWYSVNPHIMCKGSVIAKYISDYFSDSIWTHNDSNSILLNGTLANSLRSQLDEWQRESKILCEFKCIITGLGSWEIHHVYPFKAVLIETLCNLGLELNYSIEQYSKSEQNMIISEFKRLHNIYGCGACLNIKVHKLFHSMYGYEHETYEDFMTFINDIINGKFNDWFSENKLTININKSVVQYFKTMNYILNDKMSNYKKYE